MSMSRSLRRYQYPKHDNVEIEAVQSFHVARSSSQLFKDGRPYCSDGTLTGELAKNGFARAGAGGVWIGSIESTM